MRESHGPTGLTLQSLVWLGTALAAAIGGFAFLYGALAALAGRTPPPLSLGLEALMTQVPGLPFAVGVLGIVLAWSSYQIRVRRRLAFVASTFACVLALGLLVGAVAGDWRLAVLSLLALLGVWSTRTIYSRT